MILEDAVLLVLIGLACTFVLKVEEQCLVADGKFI
jgi:hypothetical protein